MSGLALWEMSHKVEVLYGEKNKKKPQHNIGNSCLRTERGFSFLKAYLQR